MLLFLLACASRPTVALPAGDPARPDVILVSIDTLRADHLGVSGYERATSPHLDALATSGTRFASTWAPSPWTLPSQATILSGALPLHHGAIETGLGIADGIPWLPEAFREAGYGTIGAAGLPEGFSRGFDAWSSVAGTADVVLAEALSRAAASAEGQPQLVFVHLSDVGTYGAPSIARYDEEIARVDDRLGAFLADWRAAGREAIVVVVSDHGEELGERHSWGHGHTLFPEALHVPWIVAGPGIAPIVVDQRVGLEDLAPTVAGLAGVPFPATDGLDRSAALRGEPMPPGGTSGRFAETSLGDSILFRWHEPPYDLIADLATGTLQLCDLRRDPTCKEDVSVEKFEEVVRIERGMYDWLGAPFEAVQSGELTSPGVFVVYGQRAPGRLAVHDRVRFALYPQDAPFGFANGSGVDGGPWQVLGGALPDEVDPVRYARPQR